MEHEVTIVETKEINDEQVAYRTVCCGLQCSLRGGDPELGCTPDSHKCHDSWITTVAGDADHDKALEDHMAAVSDRHERKLQWKDKAALHAAKRLSVDDAGVASFVTDSPTITTDM